MGILSDWGRRRKQWRTPQSQCEHINSASRTNRRDRRNRSNRSSDNFFVRCIKLQQSKQLHNSRAWWSLSIYPDIFWTRNDKSNNNSKSNNYTKRHRYNKHLYAIATIGSLLSPNVALAQGVGGVSATANPIANSSGSVTNQAIQVLQGPYVTNTYGGGVSCQGTTLNMTPYIQFADSRKDPWEDFYNEPQYNTTDATGKMVPTYVTVQNYPWEEWYDDRTYTDDNGDEVRWFPDGSDITIIQDVDSPNGVPDVVDTGGEMTPSWFKPVRTDMRANQSFNVGLSATLSIPLNRSMQKKCSEAATSQIAAVNQATANKRLDFEIARLKNCGELMKAGIMFHPNSPYHSICADVVVTAPGGLVLPHEHQIPQPKWTPPTTSSSSEVNPSSLDTDQSSSLEESDGVDSSQASSELFVITFFTTGFTAFRSRSARGLANRADAVATVAIVAVVVTTPIDGKNCSTAGTGSQIVSQILPSGVSLYSFTCSSPF